MFYGRTQNIVPVSCSRKSPNGYNITGQIDVEPCCHMAEGSCLSKVYHVVLDGTVLTGTAGHKTVVKVVPWSRPHIRVPLPLPVPSGREHLSRCALPFRPVEDRPPFILGPEAFITHLRRALE